MVIILERIENKDNEIDYENIEKILFETLKKPINQFHNEDSDQILYEFDSVGLIVTEYTRLFERKDGTSDEQYDTGIKYFDKILMPSNGTSKLLDKLKNILEDSYSIIKR
jgi:hypothetical protein